MGCTSSKGNNDSSATTVSDNNQQLINDQFRQWLKSNRPKADEYVLNNIISTVPQSDDINDYRTIVNKALDLVVGRTDIKTTNKLGKIVQKEISLASPKKVAHTIDILKQTAEKLQHGQIILDDNQQQTEATNGEKNHDLSASENKPGQILAGEPGIGLKEALEKARILFYKGKQAAIFANPSGGYSVKVIDEDDDALKQDGNLLRSIVVTEVKMRPKQTTKQSSHFSSTVPPPPLSKLINENEIGDDFRRSIDAALKGLEAIYQTSPTKSSEQTQEAPLHKIVSSDVTKPISDDNVANLAEINHEETIIKNDNDKEQQAINQADIQPKVVTAIDNMNEIMLDIIETTTESEIGNPTPPKNVERIVKEVKEHGETNEANRNSSIAQSSSDSVDHVTLVENQVSLTSSIPEQNMNSDDENNPVKSSIITEEKFGEEQTNADELSDVKPINLSTSEIDTSTVLDQIEKESSMPSPVATTSTMDTNETVKTPTHSVTYTEIIHSESRDGEQSRHFVTESYDDHPSNKDDETTTLKVVTKSEFSNDPSSGEKVMEQSVQVITVKVRNETTTTTKNLSSATEDNDNSHDNQTIHNDANISTDITN